MTQEAQRNHSIARSAAFATTLFIVGCAHVSPEPFDQFSQSVEQLRKGADDVLSVVNERNRTRYVEETAGASLTLDGAEAVLDLKLDVGSTGDPFGWSWPSGSPPLFLESQRFRSGVYALNSTLVSYSGLLANLAGENLIPREEFDRLATDLNDNLRSASSALRAQPSSADLAIISTAASAAFHKYLEHERRAELEKALKENQANIQAISELMQDALRITARNLRQNYDEASLAATRRLTPSADGSLNSRKSRVVGFISLNEEYITRLAALRTLNQSYIALPQAHRELIAATRNSGVSIASTRELYDNGKHLHELYKMLTKEAVGAI